MFSCAAAGNEQRATFVQIERQYRPAPPMRIRALLVLRPDTPRYRIDHRPKRTHGELQFLFAQRIADMNAIQKCRPGIVALRHFLEERRIAGPDKDVVAIFLAWNMGERIAMAITLNRERAQQGTDRF